MVGKKKVKGIAGDWAANDHPLAHPPLQKTMPWLYDEYKKETGRDPDEEYPVYEPCHTLMLEAGLTCIEAAGGRTGSGHGKTLHHSRLPLQTRGRRRGNGPVGGHCRRVREETGGVEHEKMIRDT
jgi:kynurenine formamidase